MDEARALTPMGAPCFRLPSDLLLWFMDTAAHPELPDDHGWYDAYRNAGFLRYTRRHYDDRLASLARFLEPGRRLLEIGSGHGIESLWLALQGWQVTGLEPAHYLLEGALRRKSALERHLAVQVPCRLELKNLLDAHEPGSYDVIFMREAFHHLEPRADAVAKIVELLKPGGAIVIAEDNAWNPGLQLLLVKRRGFRTIVQVQGPDGHEMPSGNERILTPGRLSRWFRPHGVVASHRYFRVLPSRLARFPWLRRLAVAAEPRLKDRTVAVPLHIHYEWIGTHQATRGGRTACA